MRLSYNQARECVFRIYAERGYYGAEELIGMLLKLDMITLDGCSSLKTLIMLLDKADTEKKKQSKLENNFRKKLKK